MLQLSKPSRLQLVFLHSLLWICFLFFPLLIYKIDFFNKQFFTRDLIDNAFLIALFYLNFYYLLPRYFNGKQVTTYFVILFVLTVVFVFQQMYVEYLFMHVEKGPPFYTPGFEMHRSNFHTSRLLHAPPPFEENRDSLSLHGEERLANRSFFEMPPFFWVGGVRRSLSGILSILLAGGFIRVAIQWFTLEKQKEELQIQRLNDELGLLKAQINPHFLFNSLNTVYSLARKGSQKTEGFILKLSEILRYVIYESSAKKVLLNNELTYIKNYIELQKYRMDSNMRIEYLCDGDALNLVIEPMLLITFVENAFKHGISYHEGSFINILLTIQDNVLGLTVSNTFYKPPVPNEYGGIGLQNVRKRLDLAYPSSHELFITDDDKIYTVQLKIKLGYD